ncbi:MAG: hypothetical protein WC523_01050 [Patescibacteria group bacterium]|jgi:hypothetical protein
MFKANWKILTLSAALLFIPFLTKADCDQNSTLDFVARDPSGSFIPGARVEVYKQGLDANGQKKPTTRFASALTDKILGIAHLSWHNSLDADVYALKVQTVSKDAASFWYYDINVGCGENLTVDKTLSGISFTIHDADGVLLRNLNFSLYSQLYDTAGSPLEEKKETLANLNSGSTGNVKVYLPQGSVRGLDNTKSDHYAIEISRSNNIKFNLYNIAVTDGNLSVVDYYLSSLRLRLQDVTGALFPSGTKVEVFKQTVGYSNEERKGNKIGEFAIGDDGYGTIEVTPGIYVLGVKGQTGTYQYFWDIEAREGRVTEHTLTTDQGWTPSDGTCKNNSKLYLALKNARGAGAAGLKFEIYEQQIDSSGLPTAGKKVFSGTVDSTGQTVATFKPDPRKTYALKVWDKNANRGDYWFFDAVKFVCDYNRNVTKTVPALKVMLRDGQGNLKKNYSFSIYSQRYDADLKPIFESSDLIANLQTGSTGETIVYLSPYDPYNQDETGLYAFGAKDSNGNTVAAYNIRVVSDQDNTFQYTFSSLSGELRDSRQKLLANKEVRVYEQSGSGSSQKLGRLLNKVRTNTSGRFQSEYPVGTYALATLDDFNQENVFWNVAAKINGGSVKLVTNLTTFDLADTQGETVSKDTSLKLYSLIGDKTSGYYRDREIGKVKLGTNKTATVSLAAGPYLIVYSNKSNREYGQAFYASNGLAQKVKFVVNRSSLLTSDQIFKISTVANSGVTTSPSQTANTTSAGSSLTSLKGRILLQVEDKGQAWYVNPGDGKKYYLGRPQEAYNLMRRFGLGISNKDFSALQSKPSAFKRLAGKILIKVEDKGRAYYFDPVSMRLNYLGRPEDAFNIIRNLGLGISNQNLNKISTGN